MLIAVEHHFSDIFRGSTDFATAKILFNFMKSEIIYTLVLLVAGFLENDCCIIAVPLLFVIIDRTCTHTICTNDNGRAEPMNQALSNVITKVVSLEVLRWDEVQLKIVSGYKR